MSNDAKKVAAGKPKVGGALYWATAGTTAPTDASTELDAAFKCLGYVNEDGFQNSTERETEDVYAWGGEKVLELENRTNDSFTYVLIECTNEDVLKHVYGSTNVTVTAGDATATPPVPKKIAIDVAAREELEEGVFVAEILLRKGIKRIVVPRGVVKEVGEVDYTDTDAVGYETTLDALPVTDGDKSVYHREYIEC